LIFRLTFLANSVLPLDVNVSAAKNRVVIVIVVVSIDDFPALQSLGNINIIFIESDYNPSRCRYPEMLRIFLDPVDGALG
jgi:hypothetical protein